MIQLIQQLERALELVKGTSIDALFDLAWAHTDPQHMGIIYYDPVTDSLRGASDEDKVAATIAVCNKVNLQTVLSFPNQVELIV